MREQQHQTLAEEGPQHRAIRLEKMREQQHKRLADESSQHRMNRLKTTDIYRKAKRKGQHLLLT